MENAMLRDKKRLIFTDNLCRENKEIPSIIFWEKNHEKNSAWLHRTRYFGNFIGRMFR
jgi:hypothetical protein